LKESQLRQQVLTTLSQYPYLLIMDQGEQFLHDPHHDSFFREITTSVRYFQSCIIWCGAVLPVDVDSHRVTVETLEGMPFDQAKTFLLDSYPDLRHSILEKEPYWKQLNHLCGGNPTLLHKSVDMVQSFYDGQVEQFITNPLPLTLSLSKYFDDLVVNLSDPEKILLYWLALRPLSWMELRRWPLVLPFDERVLMQAWDMLRRRHLIRSSAENNGLWQITPCYLSLYIINKLQEIFVQEVTEETLSLFHSYPVLLPQASLEQQNVVCKYLLQPVANSLNRQFVQQELRAKLIRLFDQLPTVCEPSRSCAAGNLFNLMAHLGISMADVAWQGLTLWYADLRIRDLKDIDFQQCWFKAAAIPTGLQGRLVTALHPTGQTMAVGDAQGLVKVYTWAGHRFSLDWCYNLGLPIQAMLITRSDKLIVATIEQIQIWDAIANPDRSYSAELEPATLDSIAVSPDSKRLATGLSDGSIQLWDLTWIEKEGEPLLGASDNVNYLTFSPDGKSIAGYDNNNQIIIWHQDPETRQYRAASAPLLLNPYGNFLTFQWTDTQLKVVEAVPEMSSQEYQFTVAIRTFMVIEAPLADDSTHFDVKELSYNPGQPHHATFSDDGAYLALCDLDHTVNIWYGTTALPERFVELPEPLYGLSICNGGHLLLCQHEHRLDLWNLRQQQRVQMWESVSDLDQYQGCKFYKGQGLSDDELFAVQRLGATLCQA
ncbi:MAG: hypothetical protein F6K31_36710, partial [Symploca sp. SIO2G7]|nr:hypothetical protein [Symploca sp. SIO2G7]